MNIAGEPERPADASSHMLQLLNSFLTVQALHVVAALGIADVLANGPAAITDLAVATGAHGPSLLRLLRLLVGTGVFTEEPDGRFRLTTLGETLRSGGPSSVRDWALYVGSPQTWQVWARLRESVMTGEPGFELAHGMPMWDYLARNPELGGAFDRWMTRQSDQHNAALVAAYDFAPFHVVADVGGGRGSTLAAILRAYPSLRGILLDLPQVVALASSLKTAGVDDRCRVVGGDMLRAVPAGADVYLVKRVLMDWGDAEAIRILRNCAEAIRAGGRVLVIEILLPPGSAPSPAKAFDVLMLLAQPPGARVRTEAEFRGLFAAAELRLARIIPTASPNSILEGVPT